MVRRRRVFFNALALAGAIALTPASAPHSNERLFFFGRPSDMVMSPDGARFAIKNSHGLIIARATPDLAIEQNLPLPNPGRDFAEQLGGNGPAGIVWAKDGTIWQADAYNTLRSATPDAAGRYAWHAALALHPDGTAAPTGLALDRAQRTLYVAASADNSLLCIDTRTLHRTCSVQTGVAPYGIAVAHGRIFVTNWGGALPASTRTMAKSDGTPVATDASTGAVSTGTVTVIDERAKRVVTSIRVGLHPSAILSDGTRLFVANAESDTISVISAQTLRVTRTIALGRNGIRLRSPEAFALSSDRLTLYVAESLSDDIAAIDVASGRVTRRTQTNRYPSTVLCCYGGRLIVADMKGDGSHAVLHHLPFIVGTHRAGGYNVYDYSAIVESLEAAPGRPAERSIPTRPRPSALSSMFRHVVYIIKENHTYDDFYGDLPRGNGDRGLCQFCSVSPNQHALALRFGVFDNFYVDGVLSADGHNWADSAMATDYVERSLAGFPRSYPSAGNDPLAYSSEGFIWDRVLAAGLTFRDYGEFIPDVASYTPSNARWADFYSDYLNGTSRSTFALAPQITQLAKFADVRYPSFSLRIPDQVRASEFINELHGFERVGTLPNLVLMALGNDHNAGNDPGYPTPASFVADNDLALGRIIEALSRSLFWKNTVVFVVEDDAQDGLDHVDGHRTAALVISAHNRHDLTDHTHYDQASVLATIEHIFGLRPMTRFDEHAAAIVAPFHDAVDLTPFDALPTVVPLNQMNPATNSANVDASRKDAERDAQP